MTLKTRASVNARHALTPDMLLDDAFKTKSYPWESAIEFAESDKYCGMRLYPNQRLMLKLWNLEYDNLTDYENKTIDQWSKSFKNKSYTVGVNEDIRERMYNLKKAGYDHFSTIIAVLGRRASKSTLGGIQLALCDAEMLWNGIPKVSSSEMSRINDAQEDVLDDDSDEEQENADDEFYEEDELDMQNAAMGISKDSSIYSVVMATNSSQAQETIFSNYYDAVVACAWLQQYILRITPFQITYQTINDRLKTLQYMSEGVPLERELSSMTARPISSNSNAVRGRAIYSYCYDEVMFGLGGNSSRSADRSIKAIRPALQTFGKNAITLFPSSPWTRSGYVYRMYIQGTNLIPEYIEKVNHKQVNQKTKSEAIDQIDKMGDAMVSDPSIMIAQLESWRLYENYKTQSFVPTYSDDYEKKKLKVKDNNGNVRVIECNTNAIKGNYVYF